MGNLGYLAVTVFLLGVMLLQYNEKYQQTKT
jgi:hypothetical protein